MPEARHGLSQNLCNGNSLRRGGPRPRLPALTQVDLIKQQFPQPPANSHLSQFRQRCEGFAVDQETTRIRKEVSGAVKITKGPSLPIARPTLLKTMPVGAVTRQRRRQRWLIRKKQIPHERLDNSVKAFLNRRPGDGLRCIWHLTITRTSLHIACGSRQPREVIVHLRLMGQDHQRKDVAGLPEVGLGHDRRWKVPLVGSLLAIDPVDSFWIMADDITKMPGCPVFTGDGILMAVSTPRFVLHQHRRHLSKIDSRLVGVSLVGVRQGIEPCALFAIGNGKLDRWAITHPGDIAVVIEVDRTGPLGADLMLLKARLRKDQSL